MVNFLSVRVNFFSEEKDGEHRNEDESIEPCRQEDSNEHDFGEDGNRNL